MKLIAASPQPPPGIAGLLIELGAGESGFSGTPVATGGMTIARFLRACGDGVNPAKLPPHLVPQTTCWLLDDTGTAVGMARIRHHLNAALLISGGHIGYFIRRSCRGRGYGREILRLALQKLWNLGEPRALLTVRPENRWSIRVIEANGGRLENEAVDPASGTLHLRYWIARAVVDTVPEAAYRDQ